MENSLRQWDKSLENRDTTTETAPKSSSSSSPKNLADL